MTYTTEQKVVVEKARFASKMDVLEQTAIVEAEYEAATHEYKAVRGAKIADIKAIAKDALVIEIDTALSNMTEGGDLNE